MDARLIEAALEADGLKAEIQTLKKQMKEFQEARAAGGSGVSQGVDAMAISSLPGSQS